MSDPQVKADLAYGDKYRAKFAAQKAAREKEKADPKRAEREMFGRMDRETKAHAKHLKHLPSKHLKRYIDAHFGSEKDALKRATGS